MGLGKHITKPEWIIGEKLGIKTKVVKYDGIYHSTKLLDERYSLSLLLTINSVFIENLYWLLLDVETPVLTSIQIDVKNVNRNGVR